MPRKMAREPQTLIATPEPQQPATASAGEPTQADSKIARVLSLLRRDNGVTLTELTEATGWLPHSTRAVLTGLRKKGHLIYREKRDGVSCYHIASKS